MNHHEAARDAAEKGLMRLIRALAVILPCIAIVQVLANAGDYRAPAAAIAVWLAVLGSGAWLVPRLRKGGLTAGETALAVAVAVVAVAAVGATGTAHRAHGVTGSVDLAILGTIWLLVLVVVSHPARVWVPAALLVYAVQGATMIRADGLSPPILSQLAAAGYIIAGVLVAFAAVRPALETRAAMAARRASMASSAATERAAAAVIRQERRARLAVLEKEALPLLRGIAGGTLDPARAGVRQECARQAEVLRRSLADHAPGGGLVTGIQPALRIAAAREVPVTVQVIGDPGQAPPPVERAVLATLDAVLGALSPRQVTLTVIASGDEVELYLPFGAPPAAAPDLARFGLEVPAAACWHAAVSAAEAGEGCLEVSWRKGDAGEGTILAQGRGAREGRH